MSKNGESPIKPENVEISNSNQAIRCIRCGDVFENSRALVTHFGKCHMGRTLAPTPPSSNQAYRQLAQNVPAPPPVSMQNPAPALRVAAGPRRFLPPNVTTIITPRPRPALPTLGQRVEETVSPDYCMPFINQLDRPIPEVIYVDDNDEDGPDLTLRL